MNLYPLYNSIRIAFISTAIVVVIAIIVSYKTRKLPKIVKGILDSVFTIPLVLPPTVIGFLLLIVLGPNRIIGQFFLQNFNIRLTMKWYSAIFSTSIVIFPLMYRTCRSAFENFDYDLMNAAKTLGLSNTYIFFRIILPNCKKGILSGVVLSFARALGEYGATSMISGYTPNQTATISTTVYQLWRLNNDAECFMWVGINIFIAFVVLLLINVLEKENKKIL